MEPKSEKHDLMFLFVLLLLSLFLVGVCSLYFRGCISLGGVSVFGGSICLIQALIFLHKCSPNFRDKRLNQEMQNKEGGAWPKPISWSSCPKCDCSLRALTENCQVDGVFSGDAVWCPKCLLKGTVVINKGAYDIIWNKTVSL